MSESSSSPSRDAPADGWSLIVQALTRPYPVTLPMVALLLLVPGYIFIAQDVAGGPVHVPALPLDLVIPLVPGWALVYGPLYLFLIVFPVLVIRQQEHVRRTVFAYLAVWMAAYACFFLYPTIAPRPAEIEGEGFALWGLKLLYGADPPYNCFPSLHVAHSFVSALTCYRLQRGLGTTLVVCATLVAVSTLFTKQHYVADVVAGALLAVIAYAVFLARYPQQPTSALDRRAAPLLALVVSGIVGVLFMGAWVAYRMGLQS
jgi:membrane-associated phospholipid phosphatase